MTFPASRYRVTQPGIHAVGERRRAAAFGIPFAMLLVSLGCVHVPSMPTLNATPWKSLPQPTDMACFASPLPLEDANRNVHQGIFCRFYFFTGPESPPIPVRGDLDAIVYKTRTGTADAPDATFHVPAEKFSKHKREDMIGTCYACWFPFHPSEPMEVLLQASLTDSNGNSVASDPIRVLVEPVTQTQAAQPADSISSQPLPSPPAATEPIPAE